MAAPPEANEHWERLSRLYHAALALDASQRQAFLADACGSNEALYQELSSLVVQSGVDAFLESPVLGKNLRVGGTRSSLAMDLLNVFNANTPTSYLPNYGDGAQYLRPLTILNPRLARLNVTVEF